VKIIGTEGDDHFVVTDDGVFGAGLHVSFESVEALTIDGGEGNDTFDILSTGSSFVTKVYGGLGSDDFVVGGTGRPVSVASRDLKGYSGLLSHALSDSTTDAAYKKTYQSTIIDGLSANVFDANDFDIAPPVIVEQRVKDGSGNFVYRMDNNISLLEPEKDPVPWTRAKKSTSS
jgi:hypothetical protein